MESFFSSLKTERTNRKVYRTRDEARADVFNDIMRFGDPRRRHTELDYLSPVKLEARTKLAQPEAHETGAAGHLALQSAQMTAPGVP